MLSTLYHTKKYTSLGDVGVQLHTAMSPGAGEPGPTAGAGEKESTLQETEPKALVQIHTEKSDLPCVVLLQVILQHGLSRYNTPALQLRAALSWETTHLPGCRHTR